MELPNVKDYKLTPGMKVHELVEQMLNAGFQATEIGRAVEIIERMKKNGATIFLSFTANMVAAGLRGVFALLAKKKFVDVIITTGGAIDHDVIKSISSYIIGRFDMDDIDLHKRGINRLGNILIPNDRYVTFENVIQNILSEIYEEKRVITPSELIMEIGKRMKDESSFIYWAYVNKIPIFCPGITDSALGLQVFFFKQTHKDFIIDVTGDMKELADIVFDAKSTGGIILGGGIAKHYTIGVNLLRGGLDYAVYITTAQPWDGSLSGARTTEAISWGKISEKANHVTISGEATVIFPLIIIKVFEDLKIW